MLKKTFKAVTAFSLLVGCYFGYVQVFAIVVRQMTTSRRSQVDPDDLDPPRLGFEACSPFGSPRRSMPPGHWSTRNDLNFRYYSADRGYWMYAQEMEQIQEENGVRYDGKRIRLKPFLAISTSRDGKKTQTITSDRAVIDLNQPLGFNAGTDGEALKVKHVLLEPNVVIHDNKGTPNDPTDDMTIGPLTTLEYDEPTQRITTDSHVVIRGLQTWSRAATECWSSSARTTPPRRATQPDSTASSTWNCFRNVHVVMHDVGKSGMMPGMKEPAPASRKNR